MQPSAQPPQTHWHWDTRHRELTSLFSSNTEKVSAVWGLGKVFSDVAALCLAAPVCIDFMKFLPVRFHWVSSFEFDFEEPVEWRTVHEWSQIETQPRLSTATEALCQGEVVAKYETEYSQRAARSKPEPLLETTYAHECPIAWAKHENTYNRFLQILQVQDPILNDDAFAQALGFPRRVISDFFLLASLWFERERFCPHADTLTVLAGQPAVAFSDLRLVFEEKQGVVEGRLLDNWERPIFIALQMLARQGR